jgi:N4-gp56 family major capsid protein
MHPNVYFQLLTDGTSTGNFFDLNKYKRPENIDKASIGVRSNVEIRTSSFVKSYASTITVYPTVIFGEQAFGASQLQSMQTVTKPLGSSGTEDPLNQRMTVGAKTFFASKILQQASIIVYESAGQA